MPSTTLLRAKVVVCGDSAVGKSAICQVFHSDGAHFPKNYCVTAGVELCVKTVQIPETFEKVEMFIYDSSGKELFSDAVQKHWAQLSLIMVVYDVTNANTFHNCVHWLEKSRDAVNAHKSHMRIPGVLLANKIDLDQRRVISPKDGKELAQKHDLAYFEVSAKEMQEVELPFYYLANEYHKCYNEQLEAFRSLS